MPVKVQNKAINERSVIIIFYFNMRGVVFEYLKERNMSNWITYPVNATLED